MILFGSFYVQLCECRSFRSSKGEFNFFVLANKRKANFINILFKNGLSKRKEKIDVKPNGDDDIIEEDDIHTLLNNEIKNVGKKITQDDTLNIPSYGLIEDNKIYDNYEYQTSIIVFLENYKKKNINNLRSRVMEQIKENCSKVIESLHLSSNGILNIKIKDDYIVDSFVRFCELYDITKMDKVGNMGEKEKKAEQDGGERDKQANGGIKKGVVLLDFCSVNMAKHMHLGHLKSLFLGYALSNVFHFFNFPVKNRSHIGDWNMNLAVVITFLILFSNERDNFLSSSLTLNERTSVFHKWEKGTTSCSNASSPPILNKKIGDNENNENTLDNNNSSDNQYNRNNQNDRKSGHLCRSAFDLEERDLKQRTAMVDLEWYMHLLNNIKEEQFLENYQKFDVEKYVDINLHNIEYIYKIGKNLYSTSDIFQKCSKLSLSMMYQKNEKILTLWNIICNNTKKENNEIFRKFRIKKLTDKGEHFYVKYVPQILQKMKDANILFKFGEKLCVLLKGREIRAFQKKGRIDGISSGINGDIISDINMGINMDTNSGGGGVCKRKGEHILSSTEQHYDITQVRSEIYESIRKNGINALKKDFTILTLQNDVAYTYAAIDIAAIYYRIKYEKAKKIIYVVDENQKKHFMQVFSIANYLNILNKNAECVCLNYGFVLNEKNKKIKTKDLSDNIFVKDILNKKNYKLINSNVRGKNEYAKLKKIYTSKDYEKLLVSSIIYSYISVKNNKRQLVNTIMKDFHSEYIHIINTYSEISLSLGKLKKCDYSSIFKKETKINIENNLKKLILNIIRFKYVAQEVIHNYNVEKLCSFLFNLSQKIRLLCRNGFVKKLHFDLEKLNINKFLQIIDHAKREKNMNGYIDTMSNDKNKLEEKEKRELNNMSNITNFDLFQHYIKNCDFLNTNNINKKYSLEELEKIKTFFFNLIFEVVIMQSYLFVVYKIFSILNLHLVKFY
ncbi:arginine--tRNA ligase, putative [Plasmodium malariae]|uniref:Arginine--tRNA ligase, putative n=1 Tax=Plasmodium malariae TaxID=5858 RepID=A0A1D3JMJ3_PLAMA|nr:arginine--tRNA ligase, putative [Plasmodium malariae]SBT87793.1 arginine--tRNA ligase, putative [Plasmodium malariae]